MSAIRCSEFAHDVLEMNLYGFFSNEEALANIPIAVPLGHLPENLHFAVTQTVFAEMLCKACRNFGRNTPLACIDLPDRVENLAWGHALEQVPMGSRLESASNFNITLKGGQNDDPSCWQFDADRT